MARFAHSVLMYQFQVILFLADFCEEHGHDNFCRRELAHIVAGLMTWLVRLGQGEALDKVISVFGWSAQWDPFPEWSWQEIQERLVNIQPVWSAYLLALTDADGDTAISYDCCKGCATTQSVLQILGHVVTHNPHHWGQIIGHLKKCGHEVPDIPLHLTWQ